VPSSIAGQPRLRSEVRGTKIDRRYLGLMHGGKMTDFRGGARILKGKHRSRSILTSVPATAKIKAGGFAKKEEN